MQYQITFPPNYSGGIKTFEVQYKEFPKYNLYSIDKESYIVHGLVENSDEAYSKKGRMVHNLQIGRYCSIAQEIHFLIGRGKNYTRVSTSNAQILHSAPDVRKKYREKGSIIIENDVWIGRNVTIMSGVTVHNGAIIAANSHVVKDVPPYAIMGGNPAKVVGYRFEQDIIDKSQMIQWWYWPDEKILENAAYFNDDIDTFCDTFYPDAKAEFENKYENLVGTGKDRYMMVVDCNDCYSVLEPVLDEFINNYYNDEQKELVLFLLVDQTGEEYISELTNIVHGISQEPAMKATICVEVGTLEDAKTCLATAGHLIINRVPGTVELMCFAEMFGDKIEVISGVDINCF